MALRVRYGGLVEAVWDGERWATNGDGTLHVLTRLAQEYRSGATSSRYIYHPDSDVLFGAWLEEQDDIEVVEITDPITAQGVDEDIDF